MEDIHVDSISLLFELDIRKTLKYVSKDNLLSTILKICEDGFYLWKIEWSDLMLRFD